MRKWYLALSMVVVSMAFGDAYEVETVEDPCDCEPNFYEYHNRIAVFNPFHQVYERIKPDAFYVGIEAWATYVVSNDRGRAGRVLGEAELRMGHNYFYNRRDHVTPFLGVGVIKDFSRERWETKFLVNGVVVRRERHHYEKPAVIYGVFGLLYDHEFNSIFNLGVNFKGLIGGSGSKNRMSWGGTVGGIDVSLPITFRFGNRRHWDFRLEPFYIYLNGSRFSRNYFGGRSTLGYRF
jgi:hypothetical protein